MKNIYIAYLMYIILWIMSIDHWKRSPEMMKWSIIYHVNPCIQRKLAEDIFNWKKSRILRNQQRHYASCWVWKCHESSLEKIKFHQMYYFEFELTVILKHLTKIALYIIFVRIKFILCYQNRLQIWFSLNDGLNAKTHRGKVHVVLVHIVWGLRCKNFNIKIKSEKNEAVFWIVWKKI